MRVGLASPFGRLEIGGNNLRSHAGISKCSCFARLLAFCYDHLNLRPPEALYPWDPTLRCRYPRGQPGLAQEPRITLAAHGMVSPYPRCSPTYSPSFTSPSTSSTSLTLCRSVSHGMADVSSIASASDSSPHSTRVDVGQSPHALASQEKFSPTHSPELEAQPLPLGLSERRTQWTRRLFKTLVLDHPRVLKVWNYVRGPRPKVDLPGACNNPLACFRSI